MTYISRVDGLSKAMRRVLLQAPVDGILRDIPHSTGLGLTARGYGDRIGNGSSNNPRSHPRVHFKLNERGLAMSTRMREESVYAATYASTTTDIPNLLEDNSLDQLLRRAEELVRSLEQCGQSSAGVRGYRDALLAHKRKVEAS
jgi:hypothetical protein